MPSAREGTLLPELNVDCTEGEVVGQVHWYKFLFDLQLQNGFWSHSRTDNVSRAAPANDLGVIARWQFVLQERQIRFRSISETLVSASKSITFRCALSRAPRGWISASPRSWYCSQICAAGPRRVLILLWFSPSAASPPLHLHETRCRACPSRDRRSRHSRRD